jgi:hypothetical protein
MAQTHDEPGNALTASPSASPSAITSHPSSRNEEREKSKTSPPLLHQIIPRWRRRNMNPAPP